MEVSDQYDLVIMKVFEAESRKLYPTSIFGNDNLTFDPINPRSPS
jgi:hypothetical protein